ncbi:MAG: hypothetical protein ABEK29_11770, partial [Bradymonadaceae bacterium]
DERAGEKRREDQPGRVRRIADGSGTSQERVEQVIQQFNMMRNMMDQFSDMGGGLLSKIPGMDKLNALSQMKDMDLGEVFGDLMGGGGGDGMPGGGDGGPLPGMGGGGADLPPGYTPPGGQKQDKDKDEGGRSKSMSRKKKKRKRKKVSKVRKKRRQKRRKNDEDEDE